MFNSFVSDDVFAAIKCRRHLLITSGYSGCEEGIKPILKFIDKHFMDKGVIFVARGEFDFSDEIKMMRGKSVLNFVVTKNGLLTFFSIYNVLTQYAHQHPSEDSTRRIQPSNLTVTTKPFQLSFIGEVVCLELTLWYDTNSKVTKEDFFEFLIKTGPVILDKEANENARRN